MPWLGFRIGRDGKKRWYIYWKVGKKRRQRALGQISRREADKELAKLVTEMDTSGPAVLSRMAIARAVDRYLDGIRLANRPATLDTYRNRLCLFVDFCHGYGITQLRQVTPDIVEEFKRARLKVNHPTTVNSNLGIVGTFFAHAVRFRWVPDNPVRKIRTVKYADSEPRVLTDEETQSILNYWHTHEKSMYFHVTRILLFTGLRSGELRHLTWNNVDLAGRSLRITAQENYGWVPKTRQSARKVPLHEDAVESFVWLRHNVQMVGCPLVVPSLSGRPKLHILGARAFERMRRTLGLEGVTIHTFRHTFASRLVRPRKLGGAGVNLVAAAKILGHANIRMTARYVHPDWADQQSGVNGLPGLGADPKADPLDVEGRA